MFEIHLEWQEAPGVRDSLLVRTWSRIELRLDGRPMTRYWSDRASSLRDGVYGSVFPLAEWIVNNWWSLLYEGLRHHPSDPYDSDEPTALDSAALDELPSELVQDLLSVTTSDALVNDMASAEVSSLEDEESCCPTEPGMRVHRRCESTWGS